MILSLSMLGEVTAGDPPLRTPSELTNLVSGLLTPNTFQYISNLTTVSDILRLDDRNQELLSKIILANSEKIRLQPYLAILLASRTNAYMEEFTRKLYVSNRYRTPVVCLDLMNIIATLAQYRRASDVEVFLEDLRSHATNFPALKYSFWSPCEGGNGPYGALVDTILYGGKEEHLAKLLELLSSTTSLQREAILSRFRLSNAQTKNILTRIANKPEFNPVRADVLKAVSEAPSAPQR